MANKNKKSLHWVRLDNAAKIYPAARRRNWSNIYRLSATLSENIDLPIMQNALNVTVKRFPTIAACLKKGAFWYYLQQVATPPQIQEEYSYPLVHMGKKEMKQCALRVIVHENRVAVEFFHSLTDGTGGLVFLKNLLAEYLEQKYHISVPLGEGIVDRTASPMPEELEDSFPKYAGAVPLSRKDTNAWQLYGEPITEGFLQVTCFQTSVQETLSLAHKYKVTATVFLGAVIMKALLNLQKEKNPNPATWERIKLSIPVNLRQLFESSTLRNFSMYTIPEIDPRLGDYTFEEICKVIVHKLGAENTAKHMSRVIATNVNDEKNPLVRIIPLPIKNLVMKAVFNRVGERKSCLSFSNMGKVTLPLAMEPYVTRFDFILGVPATAPYHCGLLSFGDTFYINFIRNIKEPELERHFFEVLKEVGLSATVESNQREEKQECIV